MTDIKELVEPRIPKIKDLTIPEAPGERLFDPRTVLDNDSWSILMSEVDKRFRDLQNQLDGGIYAGLPNTGYVDLLQNLHIISPERLKAFVSSREINVEGFTDNLTAMTIMAVKKLIDPGFVPSPENLRSEMRFYKDGGLSSKLDDIFLMSHQKLLMTIGRDGVYSLFFKENILIPNNWHRAKVRNSNR